MSGIDYADIIVVRTSINKGTSTTDRPVLPSEFMGKQNEEKSKELLSRAGDPWIMSNKGTSKIKLSEMRKPKPRKITGLYISTGKGTGRVKI